MPSVNNNYTLDEERAFKQADCLLIAGKLAKKQLPTQTPLASCFALFPSKNNPDAIAVYRTKVSTNLESLVLYTESSHNTKQYSEYEEVEKVNDHHKIRFYVMLCRPFKPRQFFVSTITKRMDDNTHVKIVMPCTSRKRATPPSQVRGEIWQIFTFTQTASNECSVEAVVRVDMKGHFPKWLLHTHLLSNITASPSRWQEHFQHQKRLSSLTLEDGEIMAIMLHSETKNSRSREENLLAFLDKNVALGELKETQFEHFNAVILYILNNRIIHLNNKGESSAASKILSSTKSNLTRIYAGPRDYMSSPKISPAASRQLSPRITNSIVTLTRDQTIKVSSERSVPATLYTSCN
jgi:hypothetical protein